MDPITIEVLEVDTPNKNNRLYKKDAVEKALGLLRNKEVFATFQSPTDPFSRDVFSVDLNSTVGLVKDIRIEGSTVIGTFSIMKTPKGLILEDLLSKGHEFDYRTNGVANFVAQNDGTVVIEDYQLISIGVMPKGQGA